MSDQDSKILMLQRLAPNAMKAYKRKKLTFFPSSVNNSQEGQAEMELDSGDGNIIKTTIHIFLLLGRKTFVIYIACPEEYSIMSKFGTN